MSGLEGSWNTPEEGKGRTSDTRDSFAELKGLFEAEEPGLQNPITPARIREFQDTKRESGIFGSSHTQTNTTGHSSRDALDAVKAEFNAEQLRAKGDDGPPEASGPSKTPVRRGPK
jgi:hypothetical protein